MEQFPALNTDCFDQHIAERLHLQEPPTDSDPVWLSKGALLQSLCRGGSRSPADGDGRGGEIL